MSLGITAAITQFLMMREFLTIFSQNELILGVILGSWTILTGMGAYSGRFFKRISKSHKFLPLSFLELAILPVIEFYLIRSLRSFFVSGVEIGPQEIFLSSLLFLAPFCLLSGLLLNLFSENFVSLTGGEKTGRVYLWDVLGDIIGGILFSFLFVYIFSSVETLFFLLMLNLVLMGLSIKGLKRIAIIPLLISVSVLFFSVDIEHELLKRVFKDHEILHHESNPFGKLTVTKKDGQINFYENGKPFSSDRETISKEEGVHYGMSQTDKPEKVLLVGGAFKGVLDEISKYTTIKRIDYIEKNPWLMKLFKNFLTAPDTEKISLIVNDPALFIRTKRNEYNAILINMPPPTTASLNRFYTIEFFNEIKDALKKDGIVSFSLPGSSNYFGKKLSLLTSSVYQTLAAVFPHILIVPGTDNYFIASNRPVQENIPELIEAKNIETKYTNDKYLKAIFTADRMEAVTKIVTKEVSINYDFKPSTYFIQIKYWFTKFDKGFLFPVLFVSFAVLISLMLFKGIGEYALTGSIFTSGFTGMSLQVILLMTFQISHGYLYNYLSILITLFFIGSFIGAAIFSKSRFRDKKYLLFLEAMLILLCCLTPLLFVSTSIPSFVYSIFNLIAGFILGAEFVFVSNFFKKEEAKRVSAYLFLFDFLGASLGAFVIGTFIIPLAGVKESCFILGLIKVLSLYLVYAKDWSCENFNIYEKTIQLFVYVILFALFSSLGIMTYFEETGIILYTLSLSNIYIYLSLILLGVGISYAMDYKLAVKQWTIFSDKIFQLSGITPFRIFNFLIFSLVAFLPIFRCYFKIPYLFCHVCPRKCIFGVIRPYLIPALLLMNIRKNTWCFHLCPIGTLQDTQSDAFKTKKGNLSIVVSLISYIMFIAICYLYFKVEMDFNLETTKATDWHTFFFKNNYSASGIVIIVSLIILSLSLFMRRSFCKLFCPVNVISKLRVQLEKLTFKKVRVTKSSRIQD